MLCKVALHGSGEASLEDENEKIEEEQEEREGRQEDSLEKIFPLGTVLSTVAWIVFHEFFNYVIKFINLQQNPNEV